MESLPNQYRPVTYAQTWASYNALYRFGRLSIIYYVVVVVDLYRFLRELKKERM